MSQQDVEKKAIETENTNKVLEKEVSQLKLKVERMQKVHKSVTDKFKIVEEANIDANLKLVRGESKIEALEKEIQLIGDDSTISNDSEQKS